jgi:hypothetical protein
MLEKKIKCVTGTEQNANSNKNMAKFIPLAGQVIIMFKIGFF